MIGVGHVARNGHLPGWAERRDVSFVAAADARPEGRSKFETAFPGARWFDSPEELFAAGAPDFVDICTPPALHAPLASAALRAGCHVLCEKPLGISPEELAPLADLARRGPHALVTVHNWAHAAALDRITRLVREGTLGTVRRVSWETLRTQPAVAAGAGNWRGNPALSGGGILIDHGWHAFYVLARWLGGRPTAVSARLETRRHSELPLEDTAEVRLDWGGADARIFLTWAADRRGNRVEVAGDEGRLVLDGGRLELFEDTAPSAARAWDFPSISEGSHHPEWFAGVIEDFLTEVRDSGARGRNLEEALLCASLLFRAKESSRRGGERLAVEASR
jgi:predicted dehydrogenase